MISDIRAIVFDLDGTLYFSEGFADEIKRGAASYIADLKGITAEAAASLIKETREQLSRENSEDATLSMVCSELGGSVTGFHAAVTPLLHPETSLLPDCRVTALLTRLAEHFELYIYTNNNLTLAGRILKRLNISAQFGRIFTIDDFWVPKPNRKVLEYIYASIRRAPEECLFVGDRYDVDLKLPAVMGSPHLLVTDIQGLLGMENLLSGQMDQQNPASLQQQGKQDDN